MIKETCSLKELFEEHQAKPIDFEKETLFCENYRIYGLTQVSGSHCKIKVVLNAPIGLGYQVLPFSAVVYNMNYVKKGKSNEPSSAKGLISGDNRSLGSGDVKSETERSVLDKPSNTPAGSGVSEKKPLSSGYSSQPVVSKTSQLPSGVKGSSNK